MRITLQEKYNQMKSRKIKIPNLVGFVERGVNMVFLENVDVSKLKIIGYNLFGGVARNPKLTIDMFDNIQYVSTNIKNKKKFIYAVARNLKTRKSTIIIMTENESI